jgi:hypothetical protein
VGFVDGEEPGAQAGHDALKAGGVEAFGGDVEQAVETGFEFLDDAALHGAGQGAVEDDGGDALVSKLLDLVFHEGDQRGDDDGEAALNGGGELVAQAFAGAGGHDAQDVPAGEDLADDLALGGTEIVEAEIVLQMPLQIIHDG